MEVTIEKIMETLSDTEQAEVLRDDFSIPMKHYLSCCLNGFNENTSMSNDVLIERFRQYAKNRAAVRCAITQNPEIAKTPVESPLVIIGLPRGGSTFLQRLLSNDTQLLVPMFWEMIESAPPGRPKTWSECDRFKKAFDNKEYKCMTGKAWDHVHKMRMGLAVECLYITQHYFLNPVDTITFKGLREFQNYLKNSPQQVKNAYEFHKMCMKCIFHSNLTEGKNLLLKGSMHAHYIDALRETYPGARIIYLRRNISDIIASYSSLFRMRVEAAMLPEEDHEVGVRVMNYLKECVSQAIAAFQRLPKTSYTIVKYSDLSQAPLETVKKIYSHFDLQLTPESEKAMQHHLVENPKYKDGVHEYSLDRFGISDEDVKKNFAEYLEYFKNGHDDVAHNCA